MFELENLNWDEVRKSESYREQLCKTILADMTLKTGIREYIKNNSGSDEEAKEVLQESIVRFFQKIMSDKDFKLEKDINAYIFGIAKNVFILLKRKTNNTQSFEDYTKGQNEIESEDDRLLIYTNNELYQSVLTHSTETCKKVLMYWSYSYSMEEIAGFMSYQSEMMARKKKHECLKKLIDFFKNNQKLKNQLLGR